MTNKISVIILSSTVVLGLYSMRNNVNDIKYQTSYSSRYNKK